MELFGGNDTAKKQLEATQRQNLAALARQQGEIDQASAAPAGRKTGRGLLTFLKDQGQGTLG